MAGSHGDAVSWRTVNQSRRECDLVTACNAYGSCIVCMYFIVCFACVLAVYEGARQLATDAAAKASEAGGFEPSETVAL